MLSSDADHLPETLRLFWERSQYTDAEQALKACFREASSADWATPSEIKAAFGTASIVGNNRVVFNICGKKYRLVVRVNYAFRVMHRGRGMNMEIKPIKNECDYRKALKEIDSLMGAQPNMPEGDRLDVLVTLW